MATLPTDAPTTPLRQRMQHDMLMRGLGSHTQQDYVRHVRRFAAFLGRAPDTATTEDIRRFQLRQHENGMGPATINGAVSALRFLFTVSVIIMTPAIAAAAVPCGSGNFQAWLDEFKSEAVAKGISQATVASSLNGVTLDQAILSRDRSQKVFNQSFEEFSGRMVPPRLQRGANMMKQYGSVLSRIEETYGVQGEVLVAIWGLETDFGVGDMGISYNLLALVIRMISGALYAIILVKPIAHGLAQAGVLRGTAIAKDQSPVAAANQPTRA